MKPKKELHPVTQYATDIVKGKIPANKWVRLACQRHLNDLKTAKKRGLYFDKAAADHIIDFFPEFLKFYEGAFSDQPFNLTPHQQFIVGSIFGWKRKADDFRRFRTAYIEEAKGQGKALALDTPIPTPTGWTTMGDIQVGAQVFDETGNICNVTAVTEVMTGHDCYKVQFSGGCKIVADADHLWKTHTHRSSRKPKTITANGATHTLVEWSKITGLSVGVLWSRLHILGWKPEDIIGITITEGIEKRRQWSHKYDRGAVRKGETGHKSNNETRTTEEISKTLLAKPNGSKSKHPQAKWNHRIDIAQALNLPDIELPIPPYTLGVWLGDGDSDCARITLAFEDWQTVEEIEKDGIPTTQQKKHSKTTARVALSDGKKGGSIKSRINTVNARLRRLNLLSNKHIPLFYFRASINQRMALLQGVMDSDGYIAKEGQCEITLCNERLSSDVYVLVKTLGYKCTIGKSDATLNGKIVGDKWRIRFQAYKNNPPARLKRKLNNLSDKPKARRISDGRMIVACSQIKSVPVRCISVDSPSQLYLAGKDMIPTHNSPLAGGIGLYCLAFDNEPGAEIYAAAVTKEQANILFRDARLYAESSESLKEMLIIDKYNIAYPGENSFFRAISSEKRGLDGKRPHVALIDEIHEHPDDVVVRKMSAGMKGRRQGLQFEITNSGYDRHSICFQHHEYTEKILEGTLQDDAWFGLMTGLDMCKKCESEGKTIPQDGCDDCDDWREEAVWEKANPNLDYLGAPFKDYLKRQVEEAKAMPLQENIVKRLNFCIWTEGDIKWITAEKWNACYDASLNIEDFKGVSCYAGLDLASKIDICSLVLLFECERGFAIFTKHYLCEDTIRDSKNKQQYELWVKQGWLTKTPGARTDQKFIEDDIKAINGNHPIMQLAFDPREAGYIVANLMDWMKEDVCIEINQGPALISEPMKEMEARIVANQLWHNGDPVLSWMMSNVVLKESRGGPIKYYYPTKTNIENKIDGAVALIMAIGRAMLQTDTKSVYEDLSVEDIKSRMSM